jgi:hypothetical protein
LKHQQHNIKNLSERTAVRQEEEFKGATKRYTYHLDDGTEITHRYDQGAVKLAKKMLDTVSEPKSGLKKGDF